MPAPTPAPPPPDRLEVAEATFADLPGWGENAVAEALPALLGSCAALAQRSPDAPVGNGGTGGRVADWLPVCEAAKALPAGDSAAARSSLERLLRPVAVTNRGDAVGLFTGYYEPTLRGSRRRGGPYRVPLSMRPPEL